MADFRREKRNRMWVRGGLAALAGVAAAAWILLTWSPHASLPHAVVPTTEASLFVPSTGVVMIVRQSPGQGDIPEEKPS
ncbi:MAG: hypothetical protein P8Z49_11660 [Acidobacteriota bacterium]